MFCQRCKKETYFLEKDLYCGRNVCNACVKSSKRPVRTLHVVICKDCWGDLKKRAVYKSLRK